MIRRAAIAAVLAAACGPSSSVTPAPAEPVAAAPAVADAGVTGAPREPADEAEQIAAIEHAINQTADAVHACYRQATAENRDVDGVVVLGVEHGEGRTARRVWVETDETGSERLTRCLVDVFEAFQWPPVFGAGDRVQLPLSFVAPQAQYTIERAHVATAQVGEGARAQTVLSGRSTGNPAVAMTWLELDRGAELPLRKHAAATALYVVKGSGTVTGARGEKRGQAIGAGDAVYAAKGRPYRLAAGPEGLALVQLFVPDAPEALPVTGAPRGADPKVRRGADVAPLSIAGGRGEVRILFDRKTAGDGAAYVGVLTGQPGMAVPAHVHDASTELLYVLRGEATMIVAGVEHPVRPAMAIQIPPGVEHAVAITGDEPLTVVQFYTPAGPEQRFKGK